MSGVVPGGSLLKPDEEERRVTRPVREARGILGGQLDTAHRRRESGPRRAVTLMVADETSRRCDDVAGGHAGHVLVGTSGWRYRGWRGDFYPPGLRQRDELAYLSSRLSSAEVNGSFYSLQRPSSYASWRDQTPDDFVFAIKGSRYITHLRRLVDVETALANFCASGLLALGGKLGPVLWQLPARQELDSARLARFFDLLPRTTADVARLAAEHDDKIPASRALTEAAVDLPLRHALEPRHDSFGTPQAAEVMRAHDIAMVVSDSAGTWPQFDTVTSGLVYVRLHGDTQLYSSGYSPAALDGWAARVRAWTDDGLDVCVYFDNDAQGHAPHDALALHRRLTGP